MHLFSGLAHQALAHNLATQLHCPLGDVLLKRFESGECYARFQHSVRGQELYILQGIGTHPHEHLFELLLLCQAAKLSFASHVHVILPYFPYARQDRVSKPREPISAKLMADLLQTAGADHVITMHLHSDQIQGFFSIPVDSLDSRPIFATYLKDRIERPVVVSPDIGGAKQAKKFADTLGAELAILHKIRSGHHQASITQIVGDVNGRRCILFDDMIDTAATLCAAKDALVQHGADPRITVAATHGLFSGPAIQRLTAAAFDEVIVTDSIPQDRAFPGLTVLPIAPLLAEVIRHIERKESVTEMYQQS